MGIQLDNDCFTVVNKNTIKVKDEQRVDEDLLWEDPLEEKSVSIDDEFTSYAPLTIDLGECSSVGNMEALLQNEDQHEEECLLVGLKTLYFLLPKNFW